MIISPGCYFDFKEGSKKPWRPCILLKDGYTVLSMNEEHRFSSTKKAIQYARKIIKELIKQ